MPPVPNHPEPLDALRARYARALEHVYDVRQIGAGAIRPGEVAANVFDALDGLRLIIGRERWDDSGLVLHISASYPATCPMADETRRRARAGGWARAMNEWLQDVPRRFAELSDDTRPLEFVGLSDQGIPHWLIKEADRA